MLCITYVPHAENEWRKLIFQVTRVGCSNEVFAQFSSNIPASHFLVTENQVDVILTMSASRSNSRRFTMKYSQRPSIYAYFSFAFTYRYTYMYVWYFFVVDRREYYLCSLSSNLIGRKLGIHPCSNITSMRNKCFDAVHGYELRKGFTRYMYM